MLQINMERPFVIFLGFVTLFAGTGKAADALKFFKSYIGTGDYVVGGAALRGQGTADAATQAITGGVGSYAKGTIHMSGVPGYTANGVPQHADILAAFLYWETIAGPGVNQSLLTLGTFRGLKVVGTRITTPGITALACVGSGGGNGNQSGAQTLLTYRADVLRYLPYKKDPVTGRPLGQRLVNDVDLVAEGLPLHTVALPDTGAGGTQSPSSGNQAFLTEGVSLVVVYRVAGAPLRAVVLYDGAYTFSSVNPLMTQTIKGFYQASTITPVARLTHIVGDGDTNFKEQLTVNGLVPTGVSANNPFQGALGQAWDNLTIDVSDRMLGNDSSISTAVTPSAQASTDCLSWGAMVFSVTVQDTDGDGLLDTWETNGFTDISDGSFVNLPAMGANPAVKDIFVEIDYMSTGGYTNATQGIVPAHSHLPARATVLDKVAAAFSARGIRIHFDVGPLYQEEAIAPNYVIVPASVARGGEAIPETTCGSIQSPTCLFPDYPGTVSWKNGFQIIKNGGTSGGVVQPLQFDHNRRNIFHYALFAHTLGLPKWRINDKTLTGIAVSGGTATVTTASPHGVSTPTVTITVLRASASSGLNGSYTASVTSPTTLSFATTASAGTYQNWGLAVSNGIPRSNSGVSDVGGGDLMITLGRWDNFKGTDFMNASTFHHELGHNLDLGHGGDISDPNNCKPNHQSTMSYLYQVRGLLNLAGIPQIDYSRQLLAPLNESTLNESTGLGAVPGGLPYLPRWYAPKSSSFLDSIIGTEPATKHCNGTPVNASDPPTVRIDGTSLTPSPLDWNNDGTAVNLALSQDINFSGVVSQGYAGFNDWANINLQQLSARRNASASSLEIGLGEDTGDELGIADGDLGIADGDLGIADGDLGMAGGDLGIADGDLGIADGDLGGELDFDTAAALGNAPHSLTAAVVGLNIDLDWGFPNVGNVSQFQVWRAACPNGYTVAAPCSLSPSIQPVRIAFVPTPIAVCDGGHDFCDTTTKKNTVYLYFVTATVNAKQSGPSNIVPQRR